MEQIKTTALHSRSVALKQLLAFSRQVKDYHRERNYVVEGHPGVSRLSEAVRARIISEYEICEDILGQYSLSDVEKYIQEVYWRLYWKGWLEWHPQVWSEYQAEIPSALDELDDKQNECYEALIRGTLGFPLMDRFAKELLETGYLHNHARMWFAAYWVHQCGLPWQLGADFFYRHLLDGDPASNTLSWRWVAGLQTRGKCYHAGADNIRKYCKYQEAGDSDLDRHLSERQELTIDYVKPEKLDSWQQTEIPAIDKEYLLWLHGEDLSFWNQKENLPVSDPVSVLAVHDDDLISRYGLSERRAAFIEQALNDGILRWNASSKVSAQFQQGNLINTLVKAATGSNVSVVAGILPAVGPLRRLVPELKHKLAEHDIRLMLWRRPEDEKILPLAQKGFFPFWKAIRERL